MKSQSPISSGWKGFLDCNPENKTGEVSRSHIFREGCSWIVILSPKLVKSQIPYFHGGRGGLGLQS